MKGLTHFISGAAFATFFPDAISMAMQEQSFIIALGGIGGILPDTLDFKFARFLERFDVEVSPDPEEPDPQAIADGVAKAINDGYRAGGNPVSLKLHTMKLSSTHFRQYTVRFLEAPDPQVEVEIGPVVTMAKDPLPDMDPIPEERRFARAPILACVDQDLDTDQVIDIFGGPDMAFRRTEDGRVKMDFIPWHRRWSHSLTIGILLGILLFGVAKIMGWNNAWLYGTIFGGGFCVHVLEDQLGVMGSNLWYPFTRERQQGLGWMHSGDAYPNFFFVWLSVILIIWNLNRFNPNPPIPLWSYATPDGTRFEEFFLYFFAIPMGILLALSNIAKNAHQLFPKAPPMNAAQTQLKDVRDEEEEDFGS